jgi:deoxyadenosine/deoxycytidine kinase
MSSQADPSNPFVAVAGSIASGKTGLVKRLAKMLDAIGLYEDISKNPYFERFYEDPGRWAFHSQVAFAADSLARHIWTLGGNAVVQDRTVYESVDVFGGLLCEQGHLSHEEFEVLTALRDSAGMMARQPTALIYLHAPPSALLARANKRGRPAERHLTEAYMQHLHKRYEAFILQWTECPVLSVDTTERDLRADSELRLVVEELELMKDN